METEVFLQGLRRFVSRRGTPSLLVSDNAQTYYRSPPGGGGGGGGGDFTKE